MTLTPEMAAALVDAVAYYRLSDFGDGEERPLAADREEHRELIAAAERELGSLVAADDPEALRRRAIGEAIRAAETGLNDALLILEGHHPDLRRALLGARGSVREAVGEPRS